MPQSRKPLGVAPNASTKGGNTNAELTRLEHQNIKAGASKRPATGASALKPAAKSNGNAGINFNYQKPTTTKQN
jgi:hypothetical protein